MHNCLTNADLPLDVRAGGGLLLLFGTPAIRLVKLTNDHITARDNKVHLRLGRHDLLLPPALATIVLRQAQCLFNTSSAWSEMDVQHQAGSPGAEAGGSGSCWLQGHGHDS
ncbi:hypothetical protein [Lentzea guizhouensis]|uniref:hypothetical protein n=1 Tax=Lentzea guizhouensis TaxID=1586287 RepID=UPI0012B68AA1|nr:hypothetical protein [Lentzea guizhouensis]